MKIERDEEQAAIQWLNRHGEAPGVLGLHAWVSTLDAGTRRALGQYLRLRRHRLHAPKVVLEITADVHASLSEYIVEEGSVSLGETIGRFLSAPRTTAGRSAPPEEVQALREALAGRDKDVADLRRTGGDPTGVTAARYAGKKEGNLSSCRRPTLPTVWWPDASGIRQRFAALGLHDYDAE